MSKCPDCGTEMKPLATSVYCPNDCDRKVAVHIALPSPPIGHNPLSVEEDYFLPKQGPFLPDPIFDDEEIDAWINSVLDDGTD